MIPNSERIQSMLNNILEQVNIIKNDFNSKKKQYKYLEETENDINFLTNNKEEKNNIEKSFDDLVEYN